MGGPRLHIEICIKQLGSDVYKSGASALQLEESGLRRVVHL